MTNRTLEAVLLRDRLVVAGAIVALAWGYVLWLAADNVRPVGGSSILVVNLGFSLHFRQGGEANLAAIPFLDHSNLQGRFR